MCRCGKPQIVWSSKNGVYERPYCVTGAIKLSGSKPAPKSICTDRVIGTGKGSSAPRKDDADEEQ
jgi:hypothetical protein